MPFSFIIVIMALIFFYIIMKNIYRDCIRGGMLDEAIEDKKDEIIKNQIKKIKEKN